MDSKIVNIKPEENSINLKTVEMTDEQVIEEAETSHYKEKVEQYIKLISSADPALIDYEYIYNKGHEFVKLYKEEYLPYIEKLGQITGKYYNSKKYTFNNTNKYFEVLSLKDNSSITKINKPTIRNVEEYLFKAKTQIQRDRHRLLEKYNSYLTDKNLSEGQIAGFNKKRSYFINKLNEYYAIEYYYNRINLINNNFVISTSSMLKDNKLEYSLKYLTNEKYNNIIENNIAIRDIFINAKLEDDNELIKNYIKNKLKLEKTENKKKTIIDVIVLNKDIILHKFVFKSNDNNSFNNSFNNSNNAN